MEQERVEKKRGNNGKIVALALALVLLIGGTYAWLTLSFNGTKKVRIESGNLAMAIKGESAGISINPAVPMTENEGKTQNDKYEFTLENTGNISSVYTVYLDDGTLETNEFAIDKSKIGYFLEKTIYNGSCDNAGTCTPVGDAVSTTSRSGNIGELASGSYYVLDSSDDSTALGADQYIVYTLRLWILDTAGTNDIQRVVNDVTQSGVYSARIGIKATQIGIEADDAYGESTTREDTWVRPEQPVSP